MYTTASLKLAIRRICELNIINSLQAPSLDDKVDFHFIAFVEHDGRLYELDGRKSGPVDCGKIDGDFLSVSE